MNIRIKITLFLLFAFLAFTPIRAQKENWTPKFKEIFKQKKTKIKYLTEFIAMTIIRKSVNKQFKKESKRALGNVHNEKNDNFLADDTYLKSLTEAPQFILNAPELRNFLEIQNFIIASYGRNKKELGKNKWISKKEKDYFLNYYEIVIDHMDRDLEEMEQVVLGNGIEVDDDLRYKRLQELERSAQAIKKFVSMLNNRVVVAIGHREAKIRETKAFRNLNKDQL